MPTAPTELFITPTLSIPLSELAFSFVRSSGPGGQNVNKVNSQAQMHWEFAENRSLPTAVKERFQAQQHRRFTTAGIFFLSSQRYRDQVKNRQDCLDKLAAMLLTAASPPKPRKKTKIPRGAKESRLRNKKQQGERKDSRRSPRSDE